MLLRRTLSVVVVLALAIFFAASAYAHHAQYYVLDGFGGVHAGGGAPVITPGTPYFGFDIAKGMAYIPGNAGEAYTIIGQ